MKLEYLEYGSPDCPLIRLYDFSGPELEQLCGQLQLLASGSVRQIELHEQPYVEAIEQCKLTLRLGPSDSGITRVRGPAVFEFAMTSEAWFDVKGRAATLADSPAAAFQWLSESGEIPLLLSSSGRW